MHRREFLAQSVAAMTVTTGCASLLGRGTTEDGAGPPSEPPPLSDENEAYGNGFTTGGAWPIHSYDASRQGFNPATSPPSGEVGAAWLRTPIEGHRTFRTTPPVTDDSHVFVGSGAGSNQGEDHRGGFVAAFDGDIGDRTWQTTVTAGTVEGVIHIDGMLLAVSSNYDRGSSTLTALAAPDGREQWSVEIPAPPVGGPIAVNGRAYVTSSAGGLTAVSLDGTHRWTRAVAEGDEYAATAPCATESTVFVGTDRGRMVAIDPDNGNQLWRTEIVDGGHRPRIQTTPTIDDETVFVSGTDYRLYAVAATDGTPRWTTRLLEKNYGNAIPSVAVVDKTVYVNTIHGGLIALRRQDGSERWRAGEQSGNLPPAVAGEVIVAPTGGAVQAYDTDGNHRWSFEMPAFDAGMAAYIMNPQVAVAHNRVYISLNDGRVFSVGAT